jgi:hypothetical protein
VKRISKWTSAIGVLAAVSAAVAVVFAAPAGAASVEPTAATSDDCPAGTLQVKFETEDLPTPGDTTTEMSGTSLGGDSFTISVTGTSFESGPKGQPLTFNWSITGGPVVDIVFVKGGGGPTSFLKYDYRSGGVTGTGATSDTNLTSPQGAVSHITFCVADPPAAAVSASSFRATRFGKVVQLRWRTLSEFDTVGFNVYRSVRGHRVKLNKRLIPAASLINSRSSNRYSFRARLASRSVAASSRFWLQEVHPNGTRSWYGPVRAVSAT